MDHLLLHQVEAHGDESHAEHQVHGTEDETQLNFLAADHSLARNDVSEPNRAEAYEAEVRAVQEVPSLPFGEQDRAEANVPAADNRLFLRRGSPKNFALQVKRLFLTGT